VLDRDLGRMLELLDDEKMAVSLDHACRVGVFVAGENEEVSGVTSYDFVLRACYRDQLRAVDLAALTDDFERPVLPALAWGVAAQVFDSLVDLAEESLVARAALIPCRIHGRAFSVIDQESASRRFSLAVWGQSLSVSRSVEQAANNEAAFRLANETLEAKAGELGFGKERTPYLCECEDEACMAVVRLTREEYEAVRAHPKRFVMAPGHQEADDRLLQQAAGFAIIEKQGEEGDLVAEKDPR